ncbi:MAG: hypothetical protein F4X66_07960 [Chloroflexi bacterium]|nr:hypothetical protein [Chloroflexota bacterium]MYE39689.1 hypothetical protein [Chloroflexota bacterium]
MTSDARRENPGRPVAATFTATLADEILVKDSSTIKYLHLRNGTFELRQSVFLVINGGEREITTNDNAS